MICRHWRGWTTRENARAYQALLKGTIMPDIFARGIDGLIRYEAMMHEVIAEDGSEETEHVTLIWFQSIDAIKAFVGEDYETAHMPQAAQAILKRWDKRVRHYEIFDERVAGTKA